MLRPLTEGPRGRINQLWAVRSAGSTTSPRCQAWTCMPPTPSGFSRLWLGPAAKPSSEMDMWHVVKVMESQTGTDRETHRRDSLQRCSSDASGRSHPVSSGRPIGVPADGRPRSRRSLAAMPALDLLRSLPSLTGRHPRTARSVLVALVVGVGVLVAAPVAFARSYEDVVLRDSGYYWRLGV